jgi:RNA polymerase sigma-70 factor (ECF subfamily)
MDKTTKWQPERYRPLLFLLVRQMQLDPRLRRHLDTSDIVQDTLVRAWERLEQFNGHTEAELVKWLKQILSNLVKDLWDYFRAEKRDLALEQSLQAVLTQSALRLEAHLADKQSSPSQRAERQELLLRTASALEQLPEDQRDVVILHHMNEASVAEIAEQLNRTKKSVVGLLYRGLRRLRELLVEEP